MSLAVEGEVPPPPVDRPVHQRRRARGRDQVQSQPEVDQIDKITTDENHRCLAEAAVSLVQALNGKIRAGLHRSGRRVGMESEVSAHASSTNSGIPRQHTCGSFIDSATEAMPRQCEAVGSLLANPLDCLEHWCAVLIHEERIPTHAGVTRDVDQLQPGR